MNTIKMYLATSGRIADLKKDFPLYQGQFQNKLLNVFVPTSILAPSFTSQSADGTVLADYVASTSVKIGMTYVSRDGSIKVSKNYYMRYLKTLTYQNVEYALYERKLPQEFTFYAGQGQNAPILIANVVNIEQDTENGTPKVLSVITTQTCSLDVMPSTNLDNDEYIEPSELENINAQINEINEILPTKQDKIDDTLETINKSVVGAINENKGRIDINTQNIEANRQNIATNRNDIDFLIQNTQMSEEYIGQLRGTTPPSNSQLTQFVRDNTDPSREPKNGDVIIFILEIDSGTDKNYKYFYTATGWQGYEIPPLETASNGSLGIIQGTYNIGSTNDTLVNISGGEILNIYAKDKNGNYRDIREYLNTTNSSITSILTGNTPVGAALRATTDSLGNNIVSTYLTQSLGATKQYVRDYSMPREFNDVDFISSTGYQDDVPTSPASGIQFTVNTNAVGDFTLLQVGKTNTADFELSSKNGYSNNIYVSASADCVVTFRLTTRYRKPGKDFADLNVELTSPITLTVGNIEKLMFGNPFTYLGEDVISLTNGDYIGQTLEVITQTSSALTFNVYSNEIYPSTFNLTSQSYVLSGIEQSISRLILLGADGVIEANRVVFEVQNADSYLEFRTNQREFLINGYLPIVGELDDTLPINITFGDTTYNVYSYMKGSTTPITIGDLKSNMTYNQDIGYSFTSKMIFLETSDYVGFVISPATITAEQLSQILDDSETVVISLDTNGTKVQLQLAPTLLNRLMKTLVVPMNAPSSIELVAIDDGNSQIMLELGDGFYVLDGKLYVSAGGGGTSNYPELNNKPILNTDNETSQTPQSNETINGTINLHKISKTGTLEDAIQDTNNRTVTDTEKEYWNNKISIEDLPKFVNKIYINMAKATALSGVINIPIVESSNFIVDWGDGTTTDYIEPTSAITHTYSNTKFAGWVYIYGDWQGIVFGNSGYTNEKKTIIEIVYDNNITSLPTYALYLSSNLTRLVLPESLTTMNNHCVFNCDALKEIIIPNSVTTIGTQVIDNCNALLKIKFPVGMTKTTEVANSKIYTIDIPNTVTEIKAATCQACPNLDNVDIPKNVSAIGQNAFYGCSSLKTVILRPITPPTIQSGTFTQYSNTGGITQFLVNSKSLKAYKQTTNLTDYADKIYPIGGNYSETITIPASSWDSATNTVTVEAVGATSEDRNVITWFTSSGGSKVENTYGLKCTAQGTMQLTFSCETIPTEDVEVSVSYTLTNY